jgi:3-oxoacyl-[acyl-carrier-protein] synthase-1
VVGVDSLLNRHALDSLQRRRRLKSSDNSDGVIPGEAAAALWLAGIGGDRAQGVHVTGIGLAREPSVSRRDVPDRALGLARAISDALAESGLPFEAVDFRVAGVTGERTAFMEASTAIARVQKVHKEELALWAPAEQIGDVGAALAACMAVVTVAGLRKGYTPGPRGLLFCASDDDMRGACVIALGPA